MKLMPFKRVQGQKAAKPTPKRRAVPMMKGKKMPMRDPDMDGDAGMAETPAAEEKEPAARYAAAARKSRPQVI